MHWGIWLAALIIIIAATGTGAALTRPGVAIGAGLAGYLLFIAGSAMKIITF